MSENDPPTARSDADPGGAQDASQASATGFASMHEFDQFDARVDPDDWRPLLYFSLYRCALAALLCLVVLWRVEPQGSLQFKPELFTGVIVAYLVYSVLALLAVSQRWARMDGQIAIQIFLDIIAITWLVHAAGGLGSGFALLLVITVAGGSILTQGRIAILFAALASLAVLTQQIWTVLHEPQVEPQYTHAGLLGVAFFATSFVISASARRLRLTEALAARRGVDLANLAELNEHIIQRMQSGIVALDEHRRVWLMNHSGQRLLGVSHWQIGDRIERIAAPLAGAHRRWSQGAGNGSEQIEPAGGALRVAVSFAKIGEDGSEGTVIFLEDAAAINQRAQQLKLAALGRLAGSIAHEIRNPLGAISHAAQLVDESPGLDDGDRRLTRIIHENSARMNAMVENILEMGRGRNAVPESLVLGDWFAEFLNEFSARRPGARAMISTQFDPVSLQVHVDRSQLHQILWNLCDNALQHAGDPPKVRIIAGIAEHNARPFLDVVDNGAGFALKERDQVFEPFFTTREKGTGLGLYIARELCDGNQASLTVEPSIDPDYQGCRFRITFQDPRRRTRVSE
ncbi:MAG: two-component system sensor histidine kinase PilS (NtrC family) [Gammaproteobacteria bacterium]|jgi:two-component system sensor histidine kinase PilS (NtrC family)